MATATLRSVPDTHDPYTRKILSNVVGKDPVRILAATPGRLSSLTRGLNGRQLRRVTASGKWSIAHLICHLVDSEIVLAFRLRMAIAESGSLLQAMDEKRWARHFDYEQADVNERLVLFRALRRDHVRLLKTLPRSGWKRYGIHAERGKETVARIAQMYAGHDVNHLDQIKALRNHLLAR